MSSFVAHLEAGFLLKFHLIYYDVKGAWKFGYLKILSASLFETYNVHIINAHQGGYQTWYWNTENNAKVVKNNEL